MAFTKPTVKRSEVEIDKITGFIMGVRKFGKTTLWANMIQEKFKDPTKGLLVSCGLEHGTNMIDNINTTHVDTFKDLTELKKWLIEEKGKEHDICMCCFDSSEELFTIFEKETIRRSNIENPNKPCKSIKAAYSGFTNGEKECAKLVKAFFNELYSAGIMPWCIGHTKLKTVRDKGSMDEEGFQKLGSSLIADYDAVCADCFDIIVTGIVNREIEERGSGDATKRYVKETERRLYFRGNELVEAGGRLKGLSVPEYIVFDKEDMGADFINVVETALRAGRVDGVVTTKSSSKATKKPIPAPVVVEDEPEDSDELDIEVDIDLDIEVEEEVFDADAARTQIRNLNKAGTVEQKAKVKATLNGVKLNDASVETLKAILAIFE